MFRIALTELLEKEYRAAVKIHSMGVATAQLDRVASERQIEIFGDEPTRIYFEIRI